MMTNLKSEGNVHTKSGESILIVEDEYVTSSVLSAILEEMGFSVVGMATTASEAVQIASDTRPDLVLMDIELRGETDGIQAAIEIKSKFDIPTIFLTAHATNEYIDRAIVADPSGYIIKPFTNKELRTTLLMAFQKIEKERGLTKENEELGRINKLMVNKVLEMKKRKDKNNKLKKALDDKPGA